MEKIAEKYVEAFVGFLALIGGLVLIAISAIIILSIVGRQLIFIGLAPIPGDFELVEIGGAFSIFCFLPWCTYQNGHATVDVFVAGFGTRLQSLLELIWNIALTGAIGLICWRLYSGMQEVKSYGETTQILEIPIWIGYMTGVFGTGLSVVVAFFLSWRSFNSITQNEGISK